MTRAQGKYVLSNSKLEFFYLQVKILFLLKL